MTDESYATSDLVVNIIMLIILIALLIALIFSMHFGYNVYQLIYMQTCGGKR